MSCCRLLLFCYLLLSLSYSSGQRASDIRRKLLLGRSDTSGNKLVNSSAGNDGRLVKSSACDCMDYWECAAKNGQVYSYCGLSDSQVCCFSAHQEESQEQITTVSSDHEHTTTVTLLDPGFHVEKNEKCGIAEVPVQINSNARFQEWPWHVAILESVGDLYICGGSLISPGVVLTAAHCLATTNKNRPHLQLKVRAGEFDVSGNHELYPHVEIEVSRVTIHPEFNNASLANDIAIVHLSQNLTYGPNIQALCLPRIQPAATRRKIPFENQICVVTGWGRRSETDETYSVKLKEIRVKLWSKEKCEERLRRNFGDSFSLPSTALCASDDNQVSGGEVDGGVCDGDGGGPLACWNKEDGRWYQRGVVSFGVGCGGAGMVPGVYSRVSSYLKWIGEQQG